VTASPGLHAPPTSGARRSAPSSVARGAGDVLLVAVACAACAFLATRIPLLAFALIGGVVLVLLARLPFRVLVPGLVLGAFASRVAVDVATVSIRPEHVLTLLLALALVVRGWGHALLRQAFAAPAGLLLAYVLYSTVISAVSSESFLRSAVILGWLALDWILVASLLTIRPSRELIHDALAWGVAISGAGAIAVWVLGAATGSTLGLQQANDEPPAAYFLSYEANILAGFLVLGGLTLLGSGSGRRRSWRTAAAFVGFAALPVTQTRAAVLALAVGLGVLLVLSADARMRRRLAVLAAAAGIGATAVIASGAVDVQRLFGKFTALLDLTSGNGGYRVTIAKMALGDLDSAQAVLFGLGTNSFSQRHLDPTRPGENVEAYLATLPLQILYDTGLVGVLLIAALVVSLLRRARASARAWAVLAAFAVVSAATSPLWFASTWLFAVLACLPTGRRALSTTPEGAPPPITSPSSPSPGAAPSRA
jgi:hypothetical protein